MPIQPFNDTALKDSLIESHASGQGVSGAIITARDVPFIVPKL